MIAALFPNSKVDRIDIDKKLKDKFDKANELFKEKVIDDTIIGLEDLLIGAQLLDLNNETFTVQKNGKTYTFIFVNDEGEGCGYTQIENNLYITEKELERNPIITKIEMFEDETEFDNHLEITFYGEEKDLARIYTKAGSGSGCGYGACVRLKCKKANYEQLLVSW